MFDTSIKERKDFDRLLNSQLEKFTSNQKILSAGDELMVQRLDSLCRKNRITISDFFYEAEVERTDRTCHTDSNTHIGRNEYVGEGCRQQRRFHHRIVVVWNKLNGVFINASELNYDTALSIYNMLKNETGVVAGNVIIMPVYSEK